MSEKPQFKDNVLKLYDNSCYWLKKDVVGEFEEEFNNEDNSNQYDYERKTRIIEGEQLTEEHISLLKQINSALKKKSDKIIRIPAGKSFNNYNIIETVYFGNVIKTSNLVGALRIRHQNEKELNYIELNIKSRFDTGKQQYFLLYMLSKALNVDLSNMNIDYSEDSEFDIVLVVLFWNLFIKSMDQGLYKEYRRFEHNDFSFRGHFDVTRHIKENTPFVGKTSYSIREHSYDNDILHLIRQTIMYIENKYSDIWESICYNNGYKEYLQYYEILIDSTPRFEFNKQYQFLNTCQRPISHPFYDEYEPLRQLSIAILSSDGVNIYENDLEEVNGVVFDVAWLWENFLANAVIEKIGYLHLERGKTESLFWYNENKGNKGPWYPDFIENVNDLNFKGASVLDAKYKFWGFEVDDIHQLLSYLYITGGKFCGAIFPLESKCNKDFVNRNLNHYNEKTMVWSLPFPIPDVETKNYNDYAKLFDELIIKYIQQLNKEVLNI